MNENANKVRSRVMVPGVRRVWGTMKNTSPAAVTTTLEKLAGSELGNKISVTRKFRNGITGRDKWWFLLKGQESVLKELETVWESVSLQTK